MSCEWSRTPRIRSSSASASRRTTGRHTWARALARFETHYHFPFSYEIVISDNASTDETEAVVRAALARGLPVQYHRMPQNLGSLMNTNCAFRQAVGEFVMYHADDDFLIPEGVEAAVATLSRQPEIAACYTTWCLYDEIRDADLGQFYALDRDETFSRGDFAAVFNLLHQKHVFPEIGIYRADALRSAWIPREFCFWAFAYLAHFLDQGAVVFLSKPAYRSVVVSTVAESRVQAGNEGVMTGWDSYRGGLEYFLNFGAARGAISLTDESRVVMDRMCKQFTANRMAVAMRFWVRAKDFIRAYELYTRLVYAGMEAHPDAVRFRDLFLRHVAAQTLAWHANSVAGVDRVFLEKVIDGPGFAALMRNLGLRDDVTVEVDSRPAPAEVGRSVVLVPNEAARREVLSLGVKPGLVFMRDDLARNVLV